MDKDLYSGETVQVKRGGQVSDHGGIVVEKLLADVPATQFTVGFAMYAPGSQTGEHPVTHEGKEFLMVLEGAIVAQVEGESYPLNTGDTIFFASTKLHRGWNPHDTPAKALFINFRID